MFNRLIKLHGVTTAWRMLAALAFIAVSGAGCTGDDILNAMLPVEKETIPSVDLGIAFVRPSEATTASPGVQAVIQWADVGAIPGTVVSLYAQRQNPLQENIGGHIWLIGDGSPGLGRDAVADGDSDIFIWDLTGVRAGDYVFIVTMQTPDGRIASVVSRDAARGTTGVLTVQTALPTPELTFTAPGSTDVTVNTGGTFDITWTDNGLANADAMVLLGLDVDDDHENGNEIVLLRDTPLSADGDSGTFTFVLLDENGDTVPDGTYTVYAIVDDNANDPVTSQATGKLIVAP